MLHRVYPRWSRHTTAVMLLLLLAAARVAYPSKSSSPDRHDSRSESPPGISRNIDDPALKIKVDTDLVQIPVTVTDRSYQAVENLTKENFEVFEDGVQQTIAHFASDEAPISLCLVFDTSLSMAGKLEKSIEA